MSVCQVVRFDVAAYNMEQLAAQSWETLVNHARKDKQPNYGPLAEQLGVYIRPIRWVLERIQTQCDRAGLPPLTILVVNKATGEPGAGFRGAPHDQLKEARQAVIHFDWSAHPNPFHFALDGTTRNALVDRVMSGSNGADAVYRKVQDRGVLQDVFREALLRAYRARCAFSGSRLKAALEAAHILPWGRASYAERISPRNGLLLNVYYHRLFDRDVLRLRENLTIAVGPNVKRNALSGFDRDAIDRVEGTTIALPRDPAQQPDPALIRRRYGDRV